MADQHLRAGRLAEAEQLARQVLSGDAEQLSATRTLALALVRSGRAKAAVQLISRLAGSDEAELADVHFYAALSVAEENRNDEAIASYRRAIELKPTMAEAHANLGILLKAAGRLDEAIASYRRSVALIDSADVMTNLGAALADQQKIDEAIDAYRRAISIDPNFANAHYNLGNAMRSLRMHEEAVQCFLRSLTLKPDLVQALSNMAMSFNDLGQHDLAMRAYDRAVAVKPDWAEPRWNRTLTHLLQGDFKRGWSEFDRRNELTPPSSRTFPGPRWDGRPMPGKTILLNYEMGLGDTLHFVRYAPLVKQRVGRVIVECQAELGELFESVAGVDEVITLTRDGLSPKYDVHCSLMRLPQLFGGPYGCDERTMPRSVPYLRPSSDRVRKWADRVGAGSGRKRVGLVWAGSPLHQNDLERSIKLSMLADLSSPDIDFFSLQRGPSSVQAATPPAGMRLIDWSADFENYADTAGLLANLDLLITVDTSVAHLAGAMGKPVWVLMPLSPDWRWMLKRPDTPWYPTMRLFRQERSNDWSAPLTLLNEALQRWHLST